MTQLKTQKVLIDAEVLLAHPDIMSSIRSKQNVPVLLAETIPILIDHRGQPTEQGRNAERVLQQIEGDRAVQERAFPDGNSVLRDDLLASFTFDGAPAFIFKRKHFMAQTAHTRLLEVASQYQMALVTSDDQLISQARANGVACHKWPRESQTRPAINTPTKPASTQLTPFALRVMPTTLVNERLSVRVLPALGDFVTTPSAKSFRLVKKISQGGEGVIYETNEPSLVCKIYHAKDLTTLRRRKIDLMVTRKIRRTDICWPIEMVCNQHSEFVGYLMPKAEGRTMFSGIFIKPAFLRNFSTWGRIDLVNLCLAFLEQIRFLHSLNILVGDINANNLLVTKDSTKLGMVDTDSFQVEDFPCPVGTIAFTAPEIQGVEYGKFMRSKEHELFAVATMLFMILLPGKTPFSQQNGGTQEENIRAKNFPYRDSADTEKFSGDNAPEGDWQAIWNHLKKDVQVAFQQTFREGGRISVETWIKLLEGYRHSIAKNYLGNEVFPSSFFFVRDPIAVPCGRCKKTITASKKYVESKARKGHSVWCQSCHKKHRLTKMARESFEKSQEVERNNQGRPAIVHRPPSTLRPTPPQVRPQPAVQSQTQRHGAASPVQPRLPPQQSTPPLAIRAQVIAPPPSQTTNSSYQQPHAPIRKSKIASVLGWLWRALFFK
jgi:serine/threonine protein kinase